MQIIDTKISRQSFLITWTDHSITEYPFIWLRDNDMGELHPDTRERVFDLASVPLDISPDNFELTPDALIVGWPNKSDKSIYNVQWLRDHRPGKARHDPAIVTQTFWQASELSVIPSFDAAACAGTAKTLYEALRTLKQYGLILISGLEDNVSAGEKFGDLIGFKRETNFGVIFEVINKKDPNNLAFTPLALPMHTDLPNQDLVPGHQFLHCYRNDATGGESIFTDGFKILADLEKEDPDKMAVLKTVSVPWRFHDQSCDIRSYRPIVTQKPNGAFDVLSYNAHLMAAPDVDAETLHVFYAAYHNLMKRIQDPKYAVHLKLQPGQMAIFDNRRLMHSRTAFDPAGGNRHLRGYYIENNEIDSRIRLLAWEIANN